MTPEKLWNMNGPKKDREAEPMKNKTLKTDKEGHIYCVCGAIMDVFSFAVVCPVCNKEIKGNFTKPQLTPEFCEVCNEKLANHEDETPCNKPQHAPRTMKNKHIDDGYERMMEGRRRLEARAKAFEKPQHTPTPWYLNAANGGELELFAKNEDGSTVCTAIVHGPSGEWGTVGPIHDANAAFIVRAVNAYEKDQEVKSALLKAAKRAFSLLSEQDDYGLNGDIAEELQKAIAKAEARS